MALNLNGSDIRFGGKEQMVLRRAWRSEVDRHPLMSSHDLQTPDSRAYSSVYLRVALFLLANTRARALQGREAVWKQGCLSARAIVQTLRHAAPPPHLYGRSGKSGAPQPLARKVILGGRSRKP